MGRRFVDLWVRLPAGEEGLKMLETLKWLGFSAAASEFQGKGEEWGELKSKAEELGLGLYRKLVLEPGSRKELLRELRANRGRYEVISVLCKDLETALVAARDGRVDTILIPLPPGYRIDRGVAALLKNRVEIPFKWFLESEGREKFLRGALEVVEVLGRKTGVVVSSAAQSALELRGPRQLAALPAVLGAGLEKALDSVSKEPWAIIEENLLKLSPNYVARGVVRVDDGG